MTKSGSLKKSLSLRFVLEAAIGLGIVCTPHRNALELARVLQCLARIKETIGRRKPSTAPGSETSQHFPTTVTGFLSVEMVDKL
ncbi:hypothetical protein SUGI_0032440 [Cryptomeria japonica]|nr:hypothetical protein SUGI_0032440 [Cryptomeria japonica]